MILQVVHSILCVVMLIKAIRWQHAHPEGADAYEALAVWAFYAGAVGALAAFFGVTFIYGFGGFSWELTVLAGLYVIPLLLPWMGLKRSIGRRANLMALVALIAGLPWYLLADGVLGHF